MGDNWKCVTCGSPDIRPVRGKVWCPHCSPMIEAEGEHIATDLSCAPSRPESEVIGPESRDD